MSSLQKIVLRYRASPLTLPLSHKERGNLQDAPASDFGGHSVSAAGPSPSLPTSRCSVPPPLPAIPVIDIGVAGPLELVRRARPQALALIDAAHRQFTGPLVRAADWRGRRWLARAGNPHLAEIDAIAAALGRPGAHGLNLSYEWACTSGVAADALGTMILRRTLDWPFH